MKYLSSLALILAVAALVYFSVHYAINQNASTGSAVLVSQRGGAALYLVQFQGRQYLFNTRGGLVEVSQEISQAGETEKPAPSSAPAIAFPNDSRPSPEMLISGGKKMETSSADPSASEPSSVSVPDGKQPIALPENTEPVPAPVNERQTRVTAKDVPDLYPPMPRL